MTDLLPINKRLIPPPPSAPGVAAATAALSRGLGQQQSQSGVVGTAASVIGATIATSESGERMVMQGPDASGSASVLGQPEGLYMLDSSGDITFSVNAAGTLAFYPGGAGTGLINWGDLAPQGITISGTVNTIAGASTLTLSTTAADGSYATLQLQATVGGHGSITANVNGHSATIASS